MMLKDYIEHLKAIIEKNSASKNFEVITASDDEGNDFNPVVYAPAVGILGKYGFTANNKKGRVVCLN